MQIYDAWRLIYRCDDKIPDLRSRTKILLDSRTGEENTDGILTLLQDAKRMNSELAGRWDTYLPDDFRYTFQDLFQEDGIEHEPSQDLYPKRLDTYQNFVVANTWNHWRTTRITILAIITQCASALNALDTPNDTSSDYHQA